MHGYESLSKIIVNNRLHSQICSVVKELINNMNTIILKQMFNCKSIRIPPFCMQMFTQITETQLFSTRTWPSPPPVC